MKKKELSQEEKAELLLRTHDVELINRDIDEGVMTFTMFSREGSDDDGLSLDVNLLEGEDAEKDLFKIVQRLDFDKIDSHVDRAIRRREAEDREEDEYRHMVACESRYW